MVTWGANTTHTFDAPAQAPSAFGPPAPAPSGGGGGGGLFGSTPTASAPPGGGLFGSSGGLFGSTPAAPAPAGGGLFGSLGAPAPSGSSLFGAPASAPGGSLFGASPAPGGSLFGASSAPGGSLFGASPAPGGSLFGASPAPGGSLFGASLGYGSASAVPRQQQQQLPAQAALQAHMDASARQEADRVRTKLDALNFAYAGMPQGDEGSKFVAIVYNPLTPEQRQLRWMQGVSTGVIPMPPRPPQVSEKQWMKAVVENPDPENYVPHPLVGATELQTRIAWQQTRAADLANHATSLHQAHETLQERLRLALQETEAKARRHVALRKRLLDVMRRVELTRCLHQPTQPDEVRVTQRLSDLHKLVGHTQHVLMQLQDQARSTVATRALQGGAEFPEAAEELVPVLKDHRQKLQKLGLAAQRDQRDVALIAKRVAVTTGSRV